MISQTRLTLISPQVSGPTRRGSEGRTLSRDSLLSERSSSLSPSDLLGYAGGWPGRGRAREQAERSFSARNFCDPQWAEALGPSAPAGVAAGVRDRSLTGIPEVRFQWEPSLNSSRGVYQKPFSALAVSRWLSDWC